MERIAIFILSAVVVVLSGCHRAPEVVLLPAGEDVLSLEEPILWGYVDGEGEWVIPPQFEEADRFTDDGYARVIYNNVLCWVDRTGGLHYAPDGLTWHDGFYNGYAHVGVWDKDTMFNLYGVIDTTFQYVVPPVCDNVEGYDYEPMGIDDNYFLNVGEWYCTSEFDTVARISTFRWHTPQGKAVYEWRWAF